MGFEYNWGRGEVLPTGYTIVQKIDLPIYDKDYYVWVHVRIKVFWFVSLNRKVAVHFY